MSFQRPGMKDLDRREHVWFKKGNVYKCCICGSISFKTPPDYPTPKDWFPDKVEPLDDSERKLAPPTHKRGGEV